MIYVSIRDRYIKSVFGKKNNSLGNGRDYDRDTKNCVGRGFLEKMRSSRQQDDRTAGAAGRQHTIGQQDAHRMHNIKI